MAITNHLVKRVYDGFFKVDAHKLVKDGKQHELLNFERGQSVALVLFNRNTGKYILVKQFRLASWLVDAQEEFLELIAGKIDWDETPEEAARRECVEEVGYYPLNLSKIISYYPSCGGSTEVVHIFAASVSSEDKIDEGGGRLDENESIIVVEMYLHEISAHIWSGGAVDSKLLIGFMPHPER